MEYFHGDPRFVICLSVILKQDGVFFLLARMMV